MIRLVIFLEVFVKNTNNMKKKKFKRNFGSYKPTLLNFVGKYRKNITIIKIKIEIETFFLISKIFLYSQDLQLNVSPLFL